MDFKRRTQESGVQSKNGSQYESLKQSPPGESSSRTGSSRAGGVSADRLRGAGLLFRQSVCQLHGCVILN